MQAASELVFGREVMLQAHGHGKYKHTLADGSYRMVRTSITRSPKTARAGGIGSMRALGDTVLEGLENEAREGRKGLCADPKPMPPWKWSQDCVCPVERDVHALRKILDFEQPARAS